MTRSLILALMMTASAARAQDAVALPTGFDGTYAPEGMACEGLALVEVKDGVMIGAEFAISVTDLVEFPGEPNRVEATLLNSGGGGEWEDSAVLTLDGEGQRLVFDYPDGTRTVWSRCG